MKLSEPMRRELGRIVHACKGRGRRGARRTTNLNTYRALERRGLVALTRGEITIIDPAGLRQLAASE